MSSETRFTNRLVREKSPYLLQHAHNPVDWFPWGEEAFAQARDENKPIFLSVGYSACHWCHVMEKETFEDETSALVLNERFVSIKVDREERPDVDEIYMTAVQMMTGHGGWPMSVFLLPDGRPFYGGTYFPPENRGGRIGFSALVRQLYEAYQERRGEVEQVAQSILADLERATRPRAAAGAPGAVVSPHTLFTAAISDMAERFDAENGGFGGAPKFPPHHALRLLTEAARNDDAEAHGMLVTTLDRMALGGIYDHLGGGFHRYATDSVWLLPHFEKMLYDNALLARVYAEAFDVTGDAAYARIARETCDWVLRDLRDPAGGFQAALDADSEGEEGKYYVWTPDAIKTVLGNGPDADAFCARYHILRGGNFADESTGRRTGANIPHLSLGRMPSGTLPDALPLSLENARSRLLDARSARVPPNKDDKVVTAWNGLMIGALAIAGKRLHEERYWEASRQAAEFCLTTLSPNGELQRRYAKGEAAISAYLDDHAFLADGLLDLAEATGEVRWADAAQRLMDNLLERFWDEEDGGFFYSGKGQETLIARSKELFDGALPSANGVAARVLARLGNRPGGEVYGERARTVLRAYHDLLIRAPQGTTTLILAAQEAFGEEAPVTSEPVTSEPVTLRSLVEVVPIPPGEATTLEFILSIAPGLHISATRTAATEQTGSPTVATITSDIPAAVGPVTFPASFLWQDPTGGDFAVYTGVVSLRVPVVVSSDALVGSYRIELTVRCQPCSESECLVPQTVSSSIGIEIVSE